MLPALFHNLEESVRTGEPPSLLYEWIENQPETSKHFQEGMISLVYAGLGEVISKVKLSPGAKRLLDVGGGHAIYSVELCRKYPGLTAIVFDFPQPLVTGHQTIASSGLGDRITAQEGNFMTDDLGSDYDAVLLFNIVHGFQPAGNLELFKRVRAVLNPGGQVFIAEQTTDKAPLPLASTVVSLLSLAYHHLLGGRVYAYEEIAGWLWDAGFSSVRKTNIVRAGSTLIVGTVE